VAFAADKRNCILLPKAGSREYPYLSGTTVTDKHKLEGRSALLSHFDGWVCRSDGYGSVGRCKQAGCWRWMRSAFLNLETGRKIKSSGYRVAGERAVTLFVDALGRRTLVGKCLAATWRGAVKRTRFTDGADEVGGELAG
jgi:hypothetical protein